MLPKHVIIGKDGKIAYIGPMLTSSQLNSIIQQQFSILRPGIAMTTHKNYLLPDAYQQEKEFRALKEFCRRFENSFEEEIKFLLEYKLDLHQISTYDRTNQIKSYFCTMNFVHDISLTYQLSYLKGEVEKFCNMTAVTVQLNWNVLKSKPLLTDAQINDMFPKELAEEKEVNQEPDQSTIESTISQPLD